MGPQQLYMHEKLAGEHCQKMLHEAEQRRLVAHVPHQNSWGRYAIARFGTFLVTVGMWLERVERHEADLVSARSL